eukprot:scaffold8421_cov114-Isochrysis_galbana.AAC.18
MALAGGAGPRLQLATAATHGRQGDANTLTKCICATYRNAFRVQLLHRLPSYPAVSSGQPRRRLTALVARL